MGDKLREAAQMALDALMQLEQDTFHPAKVFPYQPAIIALRAALAQPEREWQGLTDEEVEGLWDGGFYDYVGISALRAIARAIEAKLKEKNNG